MPESSFSAELRDLAIGLEHVAEEGRQPIIETPLRTLLAVCHEFDDASSRSWIGYHSLVYYRDFQLPHAGARFSSEWGLMPLAPAGETRGDWVEYRRGDVVKAIEDRAGNPDLRVAQNYSTRAKEYLESSRASVLSILTAASRFHDDALLKESLENVRTFAPLSQADSVAAQLPSRDVSSRDSTAMH